MGFFLCPVADCGVGSTGRKPGGSRAGEDPSLARTLQPRPGDRERYSGVSWAARLGRGRRSRNRIPALFRTVCWPRGLRLSAFPDGIRSPSKTKKGGRESNPRAGKGQGRACEGQVGLRQLRNWSQILPLAKRMDRVLHSTVTSFRCLLLLNLAFSDPQPPFVQPVASSVLLPCPDAKSR